MHQEAVKAPWHSNTYYSFKYDVLQQASNLGGSFVPSAIRLHNKPNLNCVAPSLNFYEFVYIILHNSHTAHHCIQCFYCTVFPFYIIYHGFCFQSILFYSFPPVLRQVLNFPPRVSIKVPVILSYPLHCMYVYCTVHSSGVRTDLSRIRLFVDRRLCLNTDGA